MTTAIKTRHTPGPWHAIRGDVLNCNRPWGVSRYLSLEECQEIDGDEAGEHTRTAVIAEVTAADTEEQAEADAKLLAAAPELLAACREATRRCFVGSRNRQADPVLQQLKAAIAKATT